jgi:hypothetical protein
VDHYPINNRLGWALGIGQITREYFAMSDKRVKASGISRGFLFAKTTNWLFFSFWPSKREARGSDVVY